MKVVIAVLIVIIAVLVAALAAWAIKDRRAEVRRYEYQRARDRARVAEANLAVAQAALDDIDAEMDNYGDIESPLAATVRQRVRQFRKERTDQTA